MKESVANVTQGPSCPMCHADVEPSDAFCNSCGFPRKGTAQEQKVFWLQLKTKNTKLERVNKKLRQARNTLFIVGTLTTLFSFGVYAWGYFGHYRGDLPRLLSNIILGLAFAALGFWSIKKPLPAILCGTALFLLLTLITIIASSLTTLNEYIYKLFVLGYLTVGIKAVFDAEKLKKELSN
jgi:peptidoglycan/LPS O-acetylase OafA/YrhL